MKHTNRLIHEKSPYLLMHAHNPVDWYPWGSEALETAKRENKPIFLSVGYSMCRRCRAMARESFENEGIAQTINEYFIAIKVDREERPDIDRVYMRAVQVLAERYGWPMSVFLRPDGKPFFGGTYFPPKQFRGVLCRVSETYHHHRSSVDEVARATAGAVGRMSSIPSVDEEVSLSETLVRWALMATIRSFDSEHGGCRTVPKLPPHSALRLLLHKHRRSGDAGLPRDVANTLYGMARGGIHDHVGGGFHRCSTDAEWLVPHFEKMLYDNALLLQSYVDAYEHTRDATLREVAEGIVAWTEREMTGPEGAFYSALYSESEGVEGGFYLWKMDEVQEVLGEDTTGTFARVYGLAAEGNYREEASGQTTKASILHLRRPMAAVAEEIGYSAEDLTEKMSEARGRLLSARNRRVHPHRDDKILTSWNGLMIGALARAGTVLCEPRYTMMAERAADFVLSSMVEGGRLLRRYRDGEARFAGYLEDYVCLADGLLRLHEATGEQRWLDRARELMETAASRFWDEEGDGFFATADDAESLLARPKDVFDQSLPSGNGVAAQVFLRLHLATSESRYLQLAGRMLNALAPWMYRAPAGTEALVLATATYVEQCAGDVPSRAAAAM